MAMGQKPVPPNIPIPTKIGSKLGGPKMGSQNGFDHHSRLDFPSLRRALKTRPCTLWLQSATASASPKPPEAPVIQTSGASDELIPATLFPVYVSISPRKTGTPPPQKKKKQQHLPYKSTTVLVPSLWIHSTVRVVLASFVTACPIPTDRVASCICLHLLIHEHRGGASMPLMG